MIFFDRFGSSTTFSSWQPERMWVLHAITCLRLKVATLPREFGLARVTVRKMVGYSIPPGYQRKEPAKRPKLGPWLGVIDAILEEDKTKPAKQRHTAKRIFDRLRAEHAFPGGYTIVKDYVRTATLR